MKSTPLGPVSTLELAVRFAETDLMGVVHHSAYAVWLEAGRIAWLDAVGVPYSEIAVGGNHFAVTGLHIEYRTPARFGDVVQIDVGLTALRSRQISFAYEVRNRADGALLATASSEHVCVDLDAQMSRIPQPVIERIQRGIESIALAQTDVLAVSQQDSGVQPNSEP